MDPVVRWIEAEDRTVLAVGASRWVARPVSARRLLQELDGYETVPIAEKRTKFRRLFRLAFPWNVTMWWRQDPLRVIEELPLEAYNQVTRDFFDWARPKRPREAPSRNSGTQLPNSMASRPPSPRPALSLSS